MDFLQALSHFLERSKQGTIHNPSAFLTIALTNASGSDAPVKSATSYSAKAEYVSSFCPSANHLLSIMAKEGFSSRDLDPDCQLYLARAKPAAQTQVIPDFRQLACTASQHQGSTAAFFRAGSSGLS